MDAVLVAAAIPIFFLAIGLELWIAKRRGRRVYVYHDSIANLSNGVGQLVFGVLCKFLTIGLYTLVYERFRQMTIEPSVLSWVLVFLGVDLGYYSFHRASHRVNFLWAVHAVHHQSEEYNLSVALRQAWFEPIVTGVFYLPLAVLGFSPLLFSTAVTLNTLYQFWVHTRLIKSLGPLEGIVNSPASHRVHHGRNPKYIDKNYSGMLVLWDRFFGTYQPESEEPVYGVVKPLHSLNPLWANFEVWAKMVEMARRTPRVVNKLRVFFAPPEWLPPEEGGRAVIPEVERTSELGWDVRAPRAIDVYVGAQFALVAVLASGFLLMQDHLHTAEIVAGVGWFVASMVAWGGLVENKRFAVPLELLRLAAAPVLGVWVFASLGVPAALPVFLTATVLSGVALLAIRRKTH